MSRFHLVLPALAALALCACQQARDAGGATAEAAPRAEADLVARGEYLTRIGGCNDCHTPGYPESSGTVPKTQWLVGSALGWNGPWGTTYPANLRLKLQEMDEAKWMDYSAGLHTRPPMPDFAVRAMNGDDRRAIYRFVRSLGPAGQPAPAYQPPGQAPKVPYVQWVLPASPPKAPAAG